LKKKIYFCLPNRNVGLWYFAGTKGQISGLIQAASEQMSRESKPKRRRKERSFYVKVKKKNLSSQSQNRLVSFRIRAGFCMPG
jgi:hypothetical protein